jgi:hypothetical protein
MPSTTRCSNFPPFTRQKSLRNSSACKVRSDLLRGACVHVRHVAQTNPP